MGQAVADTTRPIDLVCWDFGDTLVDERFMRIAPDGVPEWGQVYDEIVDARPAWVEALDLGRGSLNDLVDPLAERLPMSRLAILKHLRVVWGQIIWFDDSRAWIDQLQGRVTQAVVTVNPHEFSGIARACGLDLLIPTIVTSADVQSASKVVQTERARSLLGLAPGVETSLLIDNKQHNIDDFVAAGGQAILYQRDAGSLTPLEALL